MKPSIFVDKVSKKYSRKPNANLHYGLSDLWRELVGRRASHELRPDEFWAVRDLSFNLNQGDTLALIGRNGSGKTTLLKMINGLIKPDTGNILIDGQVQALINLGAGFNPTLIGRENIFNAAALMGFSRKETNAVMDEIVDFAELGEFIDSPVETYSSGMKARLGFSVAINLRPTIMLIDEILSVGDHAFQNKCFVKMHQLKKSGVTIVLVSHSHTNVVQICERAIWMHKGKMVEMGGAQDVVKNYLDFLDGNETDKIQALNQLRQESALLDKKKDEQRKAREASRNGKESGIYGPIYDEFDRIRNLKVEFLVNGRETDALRVHDEVVIKYSFELLEEVTDLNVSLCFYRTDGLKLSTISTLNDNLLKPIHRGRVSCKVTIPDFNVNPCNMALVMPIHEGKSYIYRDVVKDFVVRGGNKLTWEMMDFHYGYEVDASGAEVGEFTAG